MRLQEGNRRPDELELFTEAYRILSQQSTRDIVDVFGPRIETVRKVCNIDNLFGNPKGFWDGFVKGTHKWELFRPTLEQKEATTGMYMEVFEEQQDSGLKQEVSEADCIVIESDNDDMIFV